MSRPGYKTAFVLGRNTVEVHLLVAEAALGRRLPSGAQVHHVNLNSLDNRGSNLVICQDTAYHRLLHVRTDAYVACGNADARKCPYCGKHDAVANLVRHAKKRHLTQYCHRECRSAAAVERRQRAA